MRNTFTFENGVRITSEFESGNLWKCQEFAPELADEIEPPAEDDDSYNEETKTQSQTTAEEGTNGGSNDSDPETKYSLTDTATLFTPTEDELYCYDLWICPDSMPYVVDTK